MLEIKSGKKGLTVCEPDCDNEIEISMKVPYMDEVYFFLTMEQAVMVRDTLDEFIK